METRKKEGQNQKGLTKIRLATTVSLKATSRKIVGSRERNIQVMRGLEMELAMLMLVNLLIVMMVVL